MVEKNNFEFELFNVHLEEHKKYCEIVKKWWEDRNWKMPDSKILSTTGMMVKYEEQPICAAWLWQTDSLLAVVTFIISAPEIRGKLKKNSIKFLVNNLENLARNLGFQMIYLPVNVSSLVKVCSDELNYVAGSKVTELFKKL